MIKIFVLLGVIVFSPFIMIIIIFESSIAMPIMLYSVMRLKMKEYQRRRINN